MTTHTDTLDGQAPEKKGLVISASQIGNFLDCPRKWWFLRVLKLREPQKGYFTFGTVLHGCIERWMAGDSSGRVPEDKSQLKLDTWTDGPLVGQKFGEPVDVFPAGWETIEEKGSKVSVTPNEAQLIRKLFTEAVERGIVVRNPSSTVEREINLPVIDGVDLTGYIDIHVASIHGEDNHPDDAGLGYSIPEIHDHKSFGESSTRYLKQPGPTDAGGNLVPIDAPYTKGDGTSPNSIGHDQQVLTYAAATSMLDGHVGDVLVRHNQYPKFKDTKGVRKVEALVSQKRLRTHWSHIQDTAKRMVLVSRIKKWTDTPGPESLDTCSKYGGCAFRGICGKRETPEVYSKRMARQAEAPRLNLPINPRKRNTKGDAPNMDIFARAKTQQAARKGGATATAAPAPSKTAAAKAAAKPTTTMRPAAPKVNSAPAPEPETVSGGAPWADPSCPACKGLGINTKGRACPICDKTAGKRNAPTSSMYWINLDGTSITAVLRAEHVDSGAEESWAGDMPTAEVQRAPTSAPAKAAAKPTFKPRAAPAPEPEPEAAETAPAEEAVEEETPAEDAPAPAPAVSAKDAAKSALARGGTETPAASRPAARAAGGAPGRPRVGITILIGTAQLKGPERPTMLATELLEKVGAELATDMGAESYWALDPFKRRERVRQKAADIAEGLGKTIIMVGSTNDPDVMSLVNGLSASPACESVFEGLR